MSTTVNNPSPEEAKPNNQDFNKNLNEDIALLRRVLSHNIRMPMAIIAGYGDLLMNGELSEEEKMEYISKICKNITYMDRVLKIFLDDRPDEHDIEVKEWFDILSAARDVVGYVKSLTNKAGIAVSVNSTSEKVNFYGSRILILRAFYNLIENSIRYMNRAGNIVITVQEMEDSVLVIYRDDGEGMDEADVAHITELSYKGSNAGSGGSGVGMFLVAKAVERNGGTLEISSGKDKGITVLMNFKKQ